jgi:hypothetical protein
MAQRTRAPSHACHTHASTPPPHPLSTHASTPAPRARPRATRWPRVKADAQRRMAYRRLVPPAVSSRPPTSARWRSASTPPACTPARSSATLDAPTPPTSASRARTTQALRGSADAQRRMAYRRLMGRGMPADLEGAYHDYQVGFTPLPSPVGIGIGMSGPNVYPSSPPTLARSPRRCVLRVLQQPPPVDRRPRLACGDVDDVRLARLGPLADDLPRDPACLILGAARHASSLRSTFFSCSAPSDPCETENSIEW